jgi:WD40 repeat protein
LQGHLSEVWALAFSPDGTNLVSGAKDGTVKWWPVSRQEKEDVLPGSWQDLLAVSKDSSKLAVQGRQGTLVFLNATNGEPEQEFRGRFRFPTPVALSADFRTIAQVREDGRVQVWNTADPATNILDVAERQISYLALSPDAHWLITSGGFVRGFRCWDLVNRTNRLIEGEISRALFSPDGRTLAVFQQTNHVQIWDVGKWSLRTSWICDVGLRDGVAAFSPDSSILAAGCSDDIVYLWDTSIGKEVGFCIGHKQGISSLAFSPDGETLASSSDDRTVKLWHVATQQELLTLRHLGGTLRGLLFSPDGTLLVGRISTISAKPGLRYYRAPQFSEIDFRE